MNKLLFAFDELKYNLKKDKTVCLAFFVSFLLGIVIGVIIAITSDSYINILSSSGNIFTKMINGSSETSKLFWSSIFKMIVPLILIFVCSLNFYSGLISFVVVFYQSVMFVLSLVATISLSGFAGIFVVIFVYLPLNICFLFALTLFAINCMTRSKQSLKLKNFSEGFNSSWFWFGVVASLSLVLLVCVFGAWIYPLFLKNAMFLIF